MRAITSASPLSTTLVSSSQCIGTASRFPCTRMVSSTPWESHSPVILTFLLARSTGVPGVTQYNILPYSNYTYEWTAKNYGIHYYHSHASASYGDGLRGPIILHPKPSVPRPWSAISKSRDDQRSMEEAYNKAGPLVIHDWRHETMDNAMTRYRYTGQDPYCIDSLLINSQGRTHCYDPELLKPMATLQAPGIENLDSNGCVGPLFGFKNKFAKVNPTQCQNSTSAMGEYDTSAYGSKDGKYAAFHILNAGTEYETCFSIDGHDMWVVATDSTFVQPQKIQILDTQLGQRYTVLVPLDKKGRYTMRVSLCNNMPQMKSGYSVLNVVQDKSTGPGTSQTKAGVRVNDDDDNDDMDADDSGDEADEDDSEDEASHSKRHLKLYQQDGDLPEISVGPVETKVQPYLVGPGQKKLPVQKPKFSNGMKPRKGMRVTNEMGTVGKQWMQYNGSAIHDAKISNYSIMYPWNKHIRPPAKSTHTYKFNLNITNGVTWALNTQPISGLTSQLDPLLWSKRPQGGAFKNTILRVPVGAVVDVIHQAATTALGNPAHPIHKHQNNVWMLGMGSGEFPYKTVAEAEEKAPGLLNLKNPIYRDSWHIPAGGWVVTRHKVEEEGIVPHHCHIVAHLGSGMMILWAQGDAVPIGSLPSHVTDAPHSPPQYIPQDGVIGLDV